MLREAQFHAISRPKKVAKHNGNHPPGQSRLDIFKQPWQALAPAQHQVRRTEKIYVVRPPEGRHHESLWEIAQNHLGDGRRYREVYELNAGQLQPDGSRLTIASLIRPGWALRMPRDAHGPGIRVVTRQEPAPRPGGRRCWPQWR